VANEYSRYEVDLRPTVNKRALGKLIAIEGIDGSGKRTQMDLLHGVIAAGDGGHGVYSTGFPQYDSWFGKMVGQFLNGDFGALEAVDPHFTALLYAGDRFEAKPKIEAALNDGKVVLIDRYIGSNLAHQTARVSPDKRAGFRRWIEHLEYDIYDLPHEDLILYLRVPPAEAQKLVAQKSQRSYTNAKQDLLEASLRHLQDAAAMYDELARGEPWVTIECFDAVSETMRPVKQIAREVLASVEPLLKTAVIPQSEKGG
jgi:dTMP kinase